MLLIARSLLLTTSQPPTMRMHYRVTFCSVTPEIFAHGQRQSGAGTRRQDGSVIFVLGGGDLVPGDEKGRTTKKTLIGKTNV
jgi:hypothetical protein